MPPSDPFSGSGEHGGSAEHGDPADSEPTPPTRRTGGYSVLSWALFLIAVAAVLVLLGGCLSALYGPLVTGG